MENLSKLFTKLFIKTYFWTEFFSPLKCKQPILISPLMTQKGSFAAKHPDS